LAVVVRAAIRVLLAGVCLSSVLGVAFGLAACGLDRNGLDFAVGLTTTTTANTTTPGVSVGSGSTSSTSVQSTAHSTTTGGSPSASTSTSSAVSDAGPGSLDAGDAGDSGQDADASQGGDDATADVVVIPDASSDPCSGGWIGIGSDGGNSSTNVGALYGRVNFSLSAGNQVTALHTTLTAPTLPPAMPPPMGSLELFASLMPNPLSAAPSVADMGAIQPTLSWGPTCVPSSPKNAYADWWASGDYVDNLLAGSSVCQGGNGMAVKAGDDLAIDLVLQGTVWSETLTDGRNDHSVTFDIDVEGLPEVFPTFAIATNGQSPVSDIVFTSTTITLASPEPNACQPALRGPNDAFSAPSASADGQTCCVSHIVLRALGVPATTTF
jgi:hypothetical protein